MYLTSTHRKDDGGGGAREEDGVEDDDGDATFDDVTEEEWEPSLSFTEPLLTGDGD